MTLRENLKDISKHSLIYMAGWAIAAIIRLGLLPVFTRYLDRAEYGTLSILDSSVELLRILCALGFGSAIVRFYNDNQDAAYRRNVMSTGAGFTLVLTIVCSLIIFPLSKPISNLILGNDQQSLFFQLALATVLLNVLRSVADSYLIVNKRSTSYVAINTLQMIFQATLNLYLIVYQKHGITGMLIGNLISAFIFSVGLYAYLIVKNGLTIKKELIVPMLKFGAPLVPSIWAAAAMHNMDRFFIRHFSTLEEVGLYSLAYQFPFMLNAIFVDSFGRIWESSSIYDIARSDDASYQYGKVCTYFMTVLAFALFSISIMSDVVIKTFAARSYFNAHLFIPVISLGVWGYSLHTFVKVGVNLSKKTHLFTINFAQAFFCNILFNILFIPRWGAMGAAWATVCTYFCFSIGGLFVYRKCFPLKLEWMRLFKVLSLAIFLVVCRQFINTNDSINELLLEITLIVLYPIILLLMMDFLTDTEKRYIKEKYFTKSLEA